MAEFTKEEQLQAVYDLKVGYTLGHADIAMLKSMASQLLASMEQEPVYFINKVVYADNYGDDVELRAYCSELDAMKSKSDFGGTVTPLYAAPQLPQPEVMTPNYSRFLIDVMTAAGLLSHGKRDKALATSLSEFCVAERMRMDAPYRAAMLQAGNHTEQHLDMVGHPGDANESVDCRLPFGQWLSQKNEPIDVDCGCVTTEAFYHWLRVAYEAGNSPVTPDDVRRMDWLVSKTVDVREPMVYGSHSIFRSQTTTDEDDDYHATKLREQIDAAMAAEQAAPQQEVK